MGRYSCDRNGHSGGGGQGFTSSTAGRAVHRNALSAHTQRSHSALTQKRDEAAVSFRIYCCIFPHPVPGTCRQELSRLLFLKYIVCQPGRRVIPGPRTTFLFTQG